MRRTVLWAALGLAVMLVHPGESSAQSRGGYRGGYRGGSGWYSDGYRGGYYRDGYYGDRYNYGRTGISIYGVPVIGSRYYPSYERSYYYGPSEEYTAPVEEEESSNVAKFEVRVPEDAELWFGNSKTDQAGALRHFESPELRPGKTFTYDLRARWRDANGKMVDRTKQVTVKAGDRIGIDFNQP